METAKNHLKSYQEHAKAIRKKVVHMIAEGKSASHIGSALSAVDIVTALYFGVLRFPNDNVSHPDRDRFILSKGHAAAVLYATLNERGFLSEETLKGFYKNGSFLTGHPSYGVIAGVEATTGSLGHGLPIGLGMALAGKFDHRDYRVFVLLSDGECDEGTVWEAVLAAGHFKLDNLVVIVDYNKIQSFGTVKEVMNLEPLADKFRSFQWSVKEVDGHDISALLAVLTQAPFDVGKPSVIIAHTIKGKGVSFMENTIAWHYKTPNDEEEKRAISEIEAS